MKDEDRKRENVRPSITRIDPETVTKDSEVTLIVYGNHFATSNYVFVDSYSPVTRFVSDSVLEAKLTSRETGAVGSRTIKVHDSQTGDLSNELHLLVEGPADA